MQGCGKEHCVNRNCLTGGNGDVVGREKRLDATDAAILALDLFNKSLLQGSDDSDGKPEYFLCVSDPQKQRK